MKPSRRLHRLALLSVVLCLALPASADTRFSRTLTLTSANTNYNLGTLIKALNSSASTEYSELIITADDANTAPVYFGSDSTNLSATDYGLKLLAGDSILMRASALNDGITATGIYLRSSSAAQKIHVEGRSR